MSASHTRAQALLSRTAMAATAALLLYICASLLCTAPALAEVPGSGWELTARTFPTNIRPVGRGEIEVDVFNVGAAAANSLNELGQDTQPITVTDVLPPGLRATNAGEVESTGNGIEGTGSGNEPLIGHALWDCRGNGQGAAPHIVEATVVSCTNNPATLPSIEGGGGMPTRATGANLQPELAIAVKAVGGASEHETNHVTIAGGGAPTPASTEDPVLVSANALPFELVGADAWFSNADGTIDTQAGSHPYEFTFSFDLANALIDGNEDQGLSPAGGEARKLVIDLPPGLVGDPTAVPQCTNAQFNAEECPDASQVGVLLIRTSQFPGQVGFRVYNLVPPPGVPAELGFPFEGVNTYIEAGVRTGGDDGLFTTINNAAQKEVIGSVLTLWNVPGEKSHDPWRTGVIGGCSRQEIETGQGGCFSSGHEFGGEFSGPEDRPFLTLPTSCGKPQEFSIEAHPWGDLATTSKLSFLSHDANDEASGFTGCGDLAFAPAITTAPDTAKADTPAGLTVEVKPPIGGLEEPEQLGTADIQNTEVTLPEGLVINPGQAAGLESCSPSQDGLTTAAEKSEGKENDGPPSCPNASKVGTVTIKSPLIESTGEKQFEGSVYVLASNPPELKLLVAASADGVNLKLVGIVHLDERTGRLTTTFEGTPELPFTDFKLVFSGGPQAALDTPTQCGSYETTADFTPWSSPFISAFDTNASFAIAEGPAGGACSSSPLPFAPTLTAGSTTDQAGGFTNFSLLLQRGDGQQRISGLLFKAPAGLTGELSKVPLCTNAQAEANTCPQASKIGHTVVESGPGPYPLVVPEPGQEPAPIYLTESYDGAPFGLSIVVPLHVGPFTLPTQRVRAKIEIDPTTTALTITTDPLPQIVAGVPTDLREVDAVIERPEFMVNPTNCDPQTFSGTATGTPPPGVGGAGASAPIASHFQVGSCRSLEFAPKFSVTTSGDTSKLDGASLTAKVSYPGVSQGTEADIAKVKVELPIELPSRLTTLQKACIAKQFEADPAACPSESKVGYAVVHTPLLPVPLQGPAIFVSHGDEAFPSLTLVLQGDGVTVDLVGATRIKNGITSTTFNTVPDAPFSTFELTLPEGPYSALGANGDLCKVTTNKSVEKKTTIGAKGHKRTVTRRVKERVASSLVMPNEFVAQNGIVIKQRTQFTVTGCAKAKPAKKAKKKKRA